MNELDKDSVRSVIQQVIEEVDQVNQSRSADISFKKPTTVKGWVMVIGGIGAFLSFLWTSVVYVQRISEHHKAPHHVGAEKLVERIETSLNSHAKNDTHHAEAELQIKIIEETRPMKQDIQRIQQDVGSIKTKVDILIDREDRR